MTTDTTDRSDRPSTSTGSAYPAPVETLLPRARELVTETGAVPSRNKLMTAFRIGAPKASALREVLTAEHAGRFPEATRQRLRLVAETSDPAPRAASEDTETEPVPALMPSVAEVARAPRTWPVLLLALPAFVAIWSGWVGLGGLAGFGIVHPLPGIWDAARLNTAITLPIGVETYAAYALHAWLTPKVPARARRFAKWSAIGSLLIGAAGQVAYHLLTAARVTAAPWPITTLVACLPVAVLGMGAALAHLLRDSD
jgi:hypothetical protein